MNPSRFRISPHTLNRHLTSSLVHSKNPQSRALSTSIQSTSRPNSARPTPCSLARYPSLIPARVRPFSRSHYLRNNAQTTFTDPTRLDLFYHLIPPPNPLSSARSAFAVSLLESPPPSSNSSTVLGWLPAEAPRQEDEAGLNDFKENKGFREILHSAISSGLSEGVDDIQIASAMQTGQGWMHINDARNVPALGRIGDPDDIIGSVRVEDGKIMAETYQPMPSYRLCTADGVTRLTDGLAAKLRAVLQQRAQEESQT
ncbi:hypothetical protein OF83DRAFT_1118563 [Amylostereum chailletii]|nr:hypothetical protein OF83DRAFT_1118563 [Amylostereum chailletii]